MDLLTVLKYILPITIVFDAAISLFLIRKITHNKQIRFFAFALITFVMWEVGFWFGIYTNYGSLGNDIVDRFGFFFGLLAQYLLMRFLVEYSGVHFPRILQKISLVLTLAILIVVVVIGVGSRVYLGEQTYSYNYSFSSAPPYSILLITYYIIAVYLNLIIIYSLLHLIHPGLSLLEKVRRKLIRNSLIFALVVTVTPSIINPLVATLIGKNVMEQLATSWYTLMSVLGAIVSSVWTVTTAYAMTRYRLFDVTVKIRRLLLLVACAIGLGLVIFGANQVLFSPYLNNLEQSVAIAMLTVVASLIMILCTRKFGIGDPILFALTEPVVVDATVKELSKKLNNYIENEFEIVVHHFYVIDPTTNHYIDSKTGMALTNLPNALLDDLKNHGFVQNNLPKESKPATALIALCSGTLLVGFIAIALPTQGFHLSQTKQDIIKVCDHYAQLLYQTIFASLIVTKAQLATAISR